MKNFIPTIILIISLFYAISRSVPGDDWYDVAILLFLGGIVISFFWGMYHTNEDKAIERRTKVLNQQRAQIPPRPANAPVRRAAPVRLSQEPAEEIKKEVE